MKLYLTLLALCCFRLISVSAAETAKPNILLILSEDLGWSDLGCYGGEIMMPNLDALCREGGRGGALAGGDYDDGRVDCGTIGDGHARLSVSPAVSAEQVSRGVAIIKNFMAAGNPFSLLTAHANG